MKSAKTEVNTVHFIGLKIHSDLHGDKGSHNISTRSCNVLYARCFDLIADYFPSYHFRSGYSFADSAAHSLIGQSRVFHSSNSKSELYPLRFTVRYSAVRVL